VSKKNALKELKALEVTFGYFSELIEKPKTAGALTSLSG
jgi:hypothetical protein